MRDFIFLGSEITADGECSHKIKRHLLLGRKAMTNLKAKTLLHKCLSSLSYDFPSSHVWLWELDHKESWVLKNWCFWTVVLDEMLESPLDCKEIQPVHPKVDQSWAFIGRTDSEAETPIIQLTTVKNWLIWKDPDSGKDWKWEEKGTTEDERIGWHHQLDGHEFEQALGVADGQGSLACHGVAKSQTWPSNLTELKKRRYTLWRFASFHQIYVKHQS